MAILFCLVGFACVELQYATVVDASVYKIHKILHRLGQVLHAKKKKNIKNIFLDYSINKGR